MHRTIRLTVFMVVWAMLILSSQPVLSQEENPDLQRGIADFRQENYEEALDSLLKARDAEADSSLAAYFLGITYKNLQNYREAEKHLKAAITLSPKIKEAILELAEVQYQLGKLTEAMDVLAIAEKEDVRPGQTAFLKGLILLKKNENLAAVESFKKARELNPELVQASDYQIGLAYLKENKLVEAEERFQEVIVKDPNADMAVFANHFIDTIDEKKREESQFRFSLGLHFQYDDNVRLTYGDTSSEDEDSREVVTMNLEYLPKLTDPWGINAQYSMYLSNHHDLASHDVQSHTATLVPSYELKNGMANLVLTYSHILVDDREYLTTTTISPTYTRLFGKNHTLQASLSYQKKEFMRPPSNIDEDRDADEYGLNLGWFYFFAQNEAYFNLNYKLSKEDTDGQNWNYIGNKGTATLLITLMDRLKLSVSGEVKHQDFDNVHTTYDKERRDTTYTASTLFSYDFYKSAELQLLYAYIRDDSNIVFYDYGRNIYSIGIEWKY